MLGRVQINKLNLIQGPLPSIENFFLFVGQGVGVGTGRLITLNQDTDLDAVLGGAPSRLKADIAAARLNAGQNWSACVLPLDAALQADAWADAWQDAVDFAMLHTSVEAVALTDPITRKADVEAMQAKAEGIMARYMRPLFFMGRTPEFDAETQTWGDYVTACGPLLSGVAADQCMISCTIWGPELGTLAGRLCNRSVTVADSPMRVATGPLLGAWAEKPVDKDGRTLDMSVLEALDRARFSVPQWYPDYPGTYHGDGNVLDVPGGDFQAIENLRVVQKGMRRVYPLAVARIADRGLNNTPASIAAAQSYFMRPLREMAKCRKILGRVFPGEIMPPRDGDIAMTWPGKYAVEIYMALRPYNSPKSITCNLLLDLSNEG